MAGSRQVLLCAYACDAPANVAQDPAVETLRHLWMQQYYLAEEAVFWRQINSMPSANRAIYSR